MNSLRKQQFDNLVDLVCPYFRLRDQAPVYYVRARGLNPELDLKFKKIFDSLQGMDNCKPRDVAWAIINNFDHTSELTVNDLTENEPFLYWCYRISQQVREHSDWYAAFRFGFIDSNYDI